MSGTYVGQMTIGAAVPGAATGISAGINGINAALPDITARIAALQAQVTALGAMPPLPDFAEMLARAVQLQAAMTLAINTPGLLPPPSIATSILALLALIEALLAVVDGINVNLTAAVNIQTLLATAGIHVIARTGTIGTVGADIQSIVTSDVGIAGNANALALVTTTGAAWTGITQVFRVTP